jgi:hypothetical protein
MIEAMGLACHFILEICSLRIRLIRKIGVGGCCWQVWNWFHEFLLEYEANLLNITRKHNNEGMLIYGYKYLLNFGIS